MNKEFLDRLSQIYSKSDVEYILEGLKIEKRLTSFRINRLKASEEEILKELSNLNLKVKKVSFLSDGYILENGEERDLWNLDAYKKGKIYLQGISSQIPVELFKIKAGDKVLDTTAAPGSKTSQIASKLDNSGEIVAIDNSTIRIEKLKYTLDKQGVKNTRIIKTDAREVSSYFSEQYFDKIIFDAPCSAEGRINFNKEKTYSFWDKNMFKKKYLLQKDILKNIIPLLKKGGELVYSTCTIAPEENEDIVHFILCNYPELKIEQTDLSNDNFRTGIKGFGKKVYKKEVSDSVRVLPNNEMEGFFVAKFIKVS